MSDLHLKASKPDLDCASRNIEPHNYYQLLQCRCGLSWIVVQKSINCDSCFMSFMLKWEQREQTMILFIGSVPSWQKLCHFFNLIGNCITLAILLFHGIHVSTIRWLNICELWSPLKFTNSYLAFCDFIKGSEMSEMNPLNTKGR